MRQDKFSSFCLLVIISIFFKPTETVPVNAFVRLFYFNSTSNRSVSEQCECGLYGLSSPLLSAQGSVAIPRAANLQACDSNTQFTVTEPPWIALIERGNCTFAEKIKVAAGMGATAAVIYNAPGKSSYPIPMSHIGEYRCVKHRDVIVSLGFGPGQHNGTVRKRWCLWVILTLIEILNGKKKKSIMK